MYIKAAYETHFSDEKFSAQNIEFNFAKFFNSENVHCLIYFQLNI